MTTPQRNHPSLLRVAVTALTLWAWGVQAAAAPATQPAEPQTPATAPAQEPAVTPPPPAVPETGGTSEKKPPVLDPVTLTPIRVAVFELDILEGVPVSGKALTDQVIVRLSALPKVVIVDREQISKVAQEHKIALKGLVDMSSAVTLGKFVNAQYIVVGRASRIGQSLYLVLKVINVQTTVQTTIATKSPAEKGIDALLENLGWSFRDRIQQLQQPRAKPGEVPDELVRLARPLVGKVFLVSVEETHVNRPLKDPAAQMTVVNRLRSLGLNAIAPHGSDTGWKKTVMESGRYDSQKIDYLLEGEGVSAHAGEIQELISCRARVELRLLAVPGRSIIVTDRGVGARVDIMEIFAAKSALEDAARQACDAIVKRLVRQLPKPKTAQP